MNPRRLYRSRRDRQLAGVAGGIAEYLEIDPTVIRILWILSVFLGGFGILLYIIMAFIVPLEPIPAPGGTSPASGGSWQAPGGTSPASGGTWPTPSPAGTVPPTGDSGAEPSTGAAGADTAPGAAGAEASDPGSSAGPTWAANPAWASNPTWGTQAPATTDGRRGGRGSLYFGVLLIAFGAIAMANLAIPGFAGSGFLWAGLVVAIGVSLIVGATRRKARER